MVTEIKFIENKIKKMEESVNNLDGMIKKNRDKNNLEKAEDLVKLKNTTVYFIEKEKDKLDCASYNK